MASYVDSACRTFQANAALSQYARVSLSSGKLVAADGLDNEVGTLEKPALAADDFVSVRLRNAQGTRKMIAAGAVTQYAHVYGADSGKVDDASNENFIGIALDSASADGDVIEVLTFSVDDQQRAIDGSVTIDEDFLGDWPAAATALTGQGAYSWTKTETNGLGVTSVDVAAWSS